jgi:hypothetical protein
VLSERFLQPPGQRRFIYLMLRSGDFLSLSPRQIEENCASDVCVSTPALIHSECLKFECAHVNPTHTAITCGAFFASERACAAGNGLAKDVRSESAKGKRPEESFALMKTNWQGEKKYSRLFLCFYIHRLQIQST